MELLGLFNDGTKFVVPRGATRVIGRNASSQLFDLSISRNQLVVAASPADKKPSLQVKNIGTNTMCMIKAADPANLIFIEPSSSVRLHVGDKLSLSIADPVFLTVSWDGRRDRKKKIAETVSRAGGLLHVPENIHAYNYLPPPKGFGEVQSLESHLLAMVERLSSGDAAYDVNNEADMGILEEGGEFARFGERGFGSLMSQLPASHSSGEERGSGPGAGAGSGTRHGTDASGNGAAREEDTRGPSQEAVPGCRAEMDTGLPAGEDADRAKRKRKHDRLFSEQTKSEDSQSSRRVFAPGTQPAREAVALL
eukprot:jgi/Mesvir1/23189/Mv22655-RA.1